MVAINNNIKGLCDAFSGTVLAILESKCRYGKLTGSFAAGCEMDRQEIIKLCMECPLYFTMPVHMRLNFVKRREQANSANGLREALLRWVKTGQFPPQT